MADPWAGLRDVSMGMDWQAMQPQKAQSNPFNAVFDPEKRSIFGLIGQMSGNPTRGEYQQEKAGGAKHAGLAGIQARINAGMSPQQAIVDFIGSQEGSQFFTSVPNPEDSIKQYLAQVAPPAPLDPMNVTEGSAVFDPNTKQELYHNPRPPEVTNVAPGGKVLTDGVQTYSNPTAETQNRMYLEESSMLPQADLARLAAAALGEASTGDVSEKKAAFDELVRKGIITQDTADKGMADLWKSVPFLDATGRTIGYGIQDMTTGGVTEPMEGLPEHLSTDRPRGVGTMPNPANPLQALPVDSAEPAVPGSYLSALPKPADIVGGVGFAPYIAYSAGGVLGQQTGITGTQAGVMIRGLDQIALDAKNIRESGRLLKADQTLLEKLIPTGMSTNSTQMADALIQWNLFLDKHIALETDKFNNSPTGEAKGKAQSALDELQSAKLNVPTIQQLEEKKLEIASEPGAIGTAIKDAWNAISGVEAGIQEGVDTVTGEGPAAPPANGARPMSFKTEAEAKAATDADPGFYQGKIITINGRKATVGYDE